MAFPESWAMLSEQLDWTPETGWRLNQTWRGPSGIGKATRVAWLAEWRAVYGNPITIGLRDDLPMEDGEAVCEAYIGYASTESGIPLPETDPDYGLIERTWTLAGVDQQLSIRENPRVEELAEFWRPWPSMIRDWCTVYSEAQSGALKEWNDAAQAGVPILPVWEVPLPPASLGEPDSTLVTNAAVLASRLITDPQATFTKSGYQLRKTEQVTSWSTLVVSHENVDRLLTWQRIVQEEPTLAVTGLIQTAGIQDLLWLKAAPEVTKTSGGNYELSQTWLSFSLPVPGSKRAKDMLFDYGDIVT